MRQIPNLRSRVTLALACSLAALAALAPVAAAQQTPRELFAAARQAAAAGDHSRALDLLEQVVEAGGKPHVPTLRASEFEPLRDDPRFLSIVERMRPCTEAQRRQFDFWIGEWDVANPQGQVVGRNVIQPFENGCVLRENYVAGAFSGTSLNFWDPTTERWHQTWIDNQGQPLHLDGGLVDDSMVLSGSAGGSHQRITWTPLTDGRVRQHWESSTDGGTTWTTAFDGYYSKRQ